MTVAQICCVDHERPGTTSIGGRWFCDEHYKKASYRRAGFWRTELIGIAGLLVFVAAVVAFDTFLQPDLLGTGLLIAGVVLAVVPAALWLYFFYRQDRLEPEPVGHVARMFVIGLALASAVGIPLTDQLFRVYDWLYRSFAITVLGSIFVIGAVEAFVIFAAIRYFIFDSPEFDERTDGVIYGTAAGLGYATALNLQFILTSGGAALGPGEIFVAEVALAHAAFGGLLGYFLGRAKLEQEPVWWLPLGLALTTALNGLFNLLRGELEEGTLTVGGQAGGLPTFTGLLLAGGLALVVTGLVAYLMRRDVARSLSDRQPPVTADPAAGDRQSSYAVVGLFGVMLLVGAIAWSNAVNRVTPFDRDGFQGAYPSFYTDAAGEGDVLRVADTLGTGAEFAIITLPLEGGRDAEDIATLLAGQRGTDYAVYKVLSEGLVTVNSRVGLTQQFAFVDPRGLTGAPPEVRRGIDYIFVDGEKGRAVVVTLLTTPDALAEVEPVFAVFLNSLEF